MKKRPLIPHNFREALPGIKEKAFSWSLEYNARTDFRTIGHVNHYSITDTPRGNLILIPGLGSNTKTEPLMQSITYWGLVSRYDVYCMDTFLGNFKEGISQEDAQKNTYPEFVKLIDMGLRIIEKQCMGQWSCLITHSAGCAGITDIFNDRVKFDKKLRFSAAIMFAPFVSKDWYNSLKTFYKTRYGFEDTAEEEFDNTAIGLMSPHDKELHQKVRYVSITPNLLNQLGNIPVDIDLMNKWNIPVTMVYGGRDRKSPPHVIKGIYDELAELENGHLFRLVEFPNSKHSFIDQHKDWSAIIRLIKSQRDPRNPKVK